MALTPEDLAAVVAAVAAELRAPAAEAAPIAAPAAPVAASPFSLAGVNMTASGKVVTDERPAVIREAAAAAPDRKAQEWARQAARLHRLPQFACDVVETVGGVEMAAHGYAWPATSGEPCKSKACTGHIL